MNEEANIAAAVSRWTELHARSSYDASLRSWLDDAVERARTIRREWELVLGPPMESGLFSLVFEVVQPSGTPAVLKIVHRGPELTNQIKILEAANGQGYVKLLAKSFGHGAILLEKLGMPLSTFDYSIDAHIDALCPTLTKAWFHAPSDIVLPTVDKVARDMGALIEAQWHSNQHLCAWETIRMALNHLNERIDAFDVTQSVVAHGDAHGKNALADPAGGYRMVDPIGILAERAFDLVFFMRDWNDESPDMVSNLRQRSAMLADLCSLEDRAIWQWGFAGRVAMGLKLVELGITTEGQRMLNIADLVAQQGYT